MLIAYAERPEAEAAFSMAAVCVPLDSRIGNAALFIRRDWEEHVRESHREYIESTFRDWKQLLDASPGVIPPRLGDLSVGPLRTVGDGECEEQDLTKHVGSFLQGSYKPFA